MDLNDFTTTSLSEPISVAYSFPNMDINSNFTMTDSSSFQYDKSVPQYVATGQDQNLISTVNDVFQIPIGDHNKMVDAGQSYLPGSEYRDSTQILRIPQYINKGRNNQYTSDITTYQNTPNYLYNPQETHAANQTVISNAFTGFAQYPQPITTNSYQLQTNLTDIGEIIPSVDYNSNSNLEINNSQNSANLLPSCQNSASLLTSCQNSASLLASSQNNNQVSLADILLGNSSSNNTTFSTGSGTLSASDLEVLSSCIQLSHDNELPSSEHTVNPEILLNRPQNSDMFYTNFHQTEVAANEDCITSEMYEHASVPAGRKRMEDKRSTMKVSCQEDKLGREKKSVIVWDDVTSLPQKMTLPLPGYCDCKNIAVDIEEKIKQQSYIKNKKELILRHAGRVVINDIELCCFVRNETAYLSSEQLFATGIFNKAAHQLFSSCGRSFPSFVDRLLVEEREYMKQKGFMSQTSTKCNLFSVGFVSWIIDYLNRDVNDTQRTIIYEKYLGHHCPKYKNLKSFQSPTPLCIPTRTYNRTKPKNKTTGCDMVTTCLVRSEKSDKFTVAEMGRLIFTDKTLAAFMLDDGREIVYVNFYQVVVYAPGVSFAEFYDLVKEFNCRLITSPEGVKNHFRALKQEIPVEFVESEWIKLSSFMQICSYLLGKLPFKHRAKVYFNQILKSKPKEIFGSDLKISLSKITFPETQVVNSGDIVSMAAASAEIGTQFLQNSEIPPLPQNTQNQLQLQKLVVSQTKSKNVKKRGRPPFKVRLHLPQDLGLSQTKTKISKTCAVQTDLELEDSCESESVPNTDLCDNKEIYSTPVVSTVTASLSKSTSSPKSAAQNIQNSVTEVKSSESRVQNDGSIPASNCASNPNDAKCGSKPHFNENVRSKYQDASTGSDQEIGCKMKVADAELSSAIDTINNLDFLNDSFELSSSSPDKLQIDLSSSRNNALTPVVSDTPTPVISDTENISNGRIEHTIASNSKVTVIANNTGEEIFECVPLFSLAELVQKDEDNEFNPYSPFKSVENRNPFNHLDENDYLENLNDQSPTKNKPSCLIESFEDSCGPMKKGCLNLSGDLKTLNQVILGEESSDWLMSPQKSSNTMTSMFDTPKSPPFLDPSGSKSPRLHSLCQKFNKLERDATPNNSLHFFAEIASASEDIVENNSTILKKKCRPTFPVKLLKHVSNVSSFINRDLQLSRATIYKNQFLLNIKLRKTMLHIYRNLGTDSTRMKSFQKLLKLTALLLSKICTISELQTNLDLLKKPGSVGETEINDGEELKGDEEMVENFTEIRPLPGTHVATKINENVENESHLLENSSNIVEKSSELTLCETNCSMEVQNNDSSDKEKVTLVSKSVLDEVKTTPSPQIIPPETSSSPEKSSPSKYKSRKRKLKDIFPQNEAKELADDILNHKQTSSDVDNLPSNPKKSKFASASLEKTKVISDDKLESVSPVINTDSVSKNSSNSPKNSQENQKINCRNPSKINREKYPALIQSLLNPAINLQPILNTSIITVPDTLSSLGKPSQQEKHGTILSLAETNSLHQTDETQSSSKKQSPRQNICGTSESQSTNSQEDRSKRSEVPEEKLSMVSVKRMRKKPVKFSENYLSPSKQPGEKKRKKKHPELKKNGKFDQKLTEKPVRPVNAKSAKKTNDIESEGVPSDHEIYVYIPPVYGATGPVIDNSTQIIPASKFRRKNKKIKDILKERDLERYSEQDPGETVLNGTDPRPSYSVIDANGKILPSPKLDNRKISMSSGGEENGNKYEIFKSC